MERVDQLIIADEVHAAVPAELQRVFRQELDKLGRMLLFDRFHFFVGKRSRMIEINPRRLGVFLREPQRSAEHMDSGIGARRVGTVLNLDDFAVLRLDERRVHIADKIRADKLFMIVASLFEIPLEYLLTRKIGGLDRREKEGAVPRVDTHRLTDRAEPVRRIPVPFDADADDPAIPAAFFVQRRHRLLKD